jgi:hypothetical protein
VESVLVSLMFLRLYTAWRFFREWLFARYASTHLASRLTDIAMDSRLAVKALLDDMPLRTLALALLLSAVVLAYLVRVAEAPVNARLLYYWNALWLVSVTMGSVGFGDIYPQTHLGRFLCLLAMAIGAALVAVLTVTVSAKLSFNAAESRLMHFLQRCGRPPDPSLPRAPPEPRPLTLAPSAQSFPCLCEPGWPGC